jgi:hypothetical protein
MRDVHCFECGDLIGFTESSEPSPIITCVSCKEKEDENDRQALEDIINEAIVESYYQ